MKWPLNCTQDTSRVTVVTVAENWRRSELPWAAQTATCLLSLECCLRMSRGVLVKQV